MGKKANNNFGNNQSQKNTHQKTNQRMNNPHQNKTKPIEREIAVLVKNN